MAETTEDIAKRFGAADYVVFSLSLAASAAIGMWVAYLHAMLL